MKKLLSIFSLSIITLLGVAQNPQIGTATIIPQSPTINDNIKIITKVTAPTMGVRVDILHNVTQNPKAVNLRTCFSESMLTAIQIYVDTFSIGQLPAGVYAIKHKAFMSSAQQHCNATDSSNVVLSFTVTTPQSTGLKENKNSTLQISPNPVQNELFIKSSTNEMELKIFNVSGQLVKHTTTIQSKIDVSDLPKGLYFIRLRNSDNEKILKFVKD